jgi:hypothetical protein
MDLKLGLDEVNIDSVLLKKAVDKINCGKYGEVHYDHFQGYQTCI